MQPATLELRVFWNDILLAVEHLTHTVTIGESKRATVFVSSDGLPLDAFPLVRASDGAYALTLCDGLDGEIQRGGEVQHFADTGWAEPCDDLPECRTVALTPQTFAVARWSGLTFAMRLVSAPERVVGSSELDLPFLNLWFLTLFVMAALITTFSLYPYETERLDEGLFRTSSRISSFILEPPKPRMEQKQLIVNEAARDPVPTPKGKPAGASGHRTTGPSKDFKLDNIGMLRALREDGGALAQVLGTTGAPIGSDTSRVIASLTSSDGGSLGIATRGTIGEGPSALTSIGGHVDTLGRSSGNPAYGTAVAGIGPKHEVDITLDPGKIVQAGSLDPALIKRVIRANRNAFRYCYERELQVRKDLDGAIHVQFVIGAEGTVASARIMDSTMHDEAVAACILSEMRKLAFPRPLGGGVVIVNYPFVFKSSL